jgi:DNA-binding transcriptional ArsR family regulator
MSTAQYSAARAERRRSWLTAVSLCIHSCCMSDNVVAGCATYQSAERVLALLRSFDDSRPEQGVTELARAIGVQKSTASRLAAVLERAGLLSRHGRRYRLGLEIIRLGTLALRSFDVVAALGPALAELSRRTGETVSVAVSTRPGAASRRCRSRGLRYG